MSDSISYWDVHLDDEIPTFGAGRRRLLLVERGSKFVTLLSPTDCAHDRTPIAVWDRLKPAELLLPAWKYQEMAVRLERVSREYGRNSAPYRAAMAALGFAVPEPELTEEQRLQRAAAAERLQVGRTRVEYVPGTGEAPGQGEGSGKLMMRLWMTGSYTPERLVEIVLSNWPGRTTKVSDVKYNFKILERMTPEERLAAYGRADLPPWPAKEPKKQVLKAEVIKPAPTPERKKKAAPEPAVEKPAAESRVIKKLQRELRKEAKP